MRLARRLHDRQDRARAFFAGAAGRWDRLSELYGDDFARCAMLALLPGDCIVADLGCGTGQVAAELAGYVGRVIAVDNSPAMLRAARKRIGRLANVEIRRGDLAALPIEQDLCDAALLILALTYVADPPAVLSEARRILKTSGKLVVVDLLPHDREDFQRRMGQQSRGFSVEQLATMLAEAGFDSIAVRPVQPATNAKGPALFMAAGGRS